MQRATKQKEREDEILEKIIELLVRELEPTRIYLFGSRAKGKAHKGSDFDIAIDGVQPDDAFLRKMRGEIEGFSGLYTIDIVFLSELNKQFRELILETGKIIYDAKGSSIFN
ncbi:MAG: hypothetical protein A3I05_07270 [Deltaproteobacteria bacterium RIFCSPLOWO2_02_FULL_44_10]|nr:MAG: hypothetical protein A3C46_04250 [Deltaproteobacteria bacterium RIFCSPHIGHO2_02_FULL_44_16]OGQ46391.1 MAG: hypothetical protein A3I05_07270 [Deltaproteobacteria bacterium RIFCSPLOWO2_02_FULL_44_10]